MPEISARDLRRLQALESRLEKEREERRDLSAERRDLRRAVAAAERAAKSAEEQVTSLVEENRRLSEELATTAADLDQLRRAGLEAREQATAAREQLRAAEKERREAEKRVTGLERERDRLGDRLKVAEGQLKGKPAKLVPASEAAGLVGTLVDELEGGLGRLAVREGEIRLRVAFGKVGRTSGLVVPTAETADELRGALHEVAIRFDRSVEPEPPPSPRQPR
jgi:chromosome segregation ATPase